MGEDDLKPTSITLPDTNPTQDTNAESVSQAGPAGETAETACAEYEKNRLDILLTVYKTGHSEAVTRVGFLFQIYQYFSVIIAAVFSYILTTKIWDAVFVLPPLSIGLLLRLLWDQHLAAIMADYLRGSVEPELARIVNASRSSDDADIAYGTKWRGWFESYPAMYDKKPQYFKHSIFVIFGLASILPAVLFSAYCCLSPHFSLPILSSIAKLHLQTGLFHVFAWTSLVGNLAALIWTYREIYRTDLK